MAKQHDSIPDTLDHRAKVAALLGLVIAELVQRAAHHDDSKFEEPERSGYATLAAALRGVEYGTPEYFAAIEASKPTVAHHYAHNRHHPEYHERGWRCMNLIDIIEMVCDWEASAQRNGSHARDNLVGLLSRFGIGFGEGETIANTLTFLAPPPDESDQPY